MNGSFMLAAFVIGFWCIWSANRDVNSLMESLGLTLIAIIARSLMEWSGMPQIDSVFLASWGILFVFNVVLLEVIDRYASSMGINMTLAVAGSVGWFFLAQYIFSEKGAAMVAGWV